MEEENTNPDKSMKDLAMHEGVSSESEPLSGLKESMKQEEEQMREKYNEFCARVEELRRSGGSQEDTKKELVDFEGKLSVFQKDNEKYSVEIGGLIDSSLEKMKEVASILEGEKSSSDKATNPEAFLGKKEDEAMQADDPERLKKVANPEGILGKKEDEAMQTDDDPESLKKHKREFELASSSHNEDPSKDFSKKSKTDTGCSGSSNNNEVDLLGVEALQQGKYKSVFEKIVKGEGIVESLKLKEQSNVSEKKKEMDQSGDQESSGATKKNVRDESEER